LVVHNLIKVCSNNLNLIIAANWVEATEK